MSHLIHEAYSLVKSEIPHSFPHSLLKYIDRDNSEISIIELDFYLLLNLRFIQRILKTKSNYEGSKVPCGRMCLIYSLTIRKIGSSTLFCPEIVICHLLWPSGFPVFPVKNDFLLFDW